jgi:glycosyltransferase involved in cell wall biosynthesis
MTRRILDGFGSAEAVACDSVTTRDAVIRYKLAPAQRLTINPNGVADIFNPRPDPCADWEVCRMLGLADPARPEILHVGSTIPRKRIDVLLRVFREFRREIPGAHLIRVGGSFTEAQARLINELELPDESLTVLPPLNRRTLATVYRRAALLVFPSESEGFGLPIIEALACGTPVVLSDIAVFREIGGPSATFCPIADVNQWMKGIVSLIRERGERPQSWSERTATGVQWAGRFTWRKHADRAANLYRTIAGNSFDASAPCRTPLDISAS